MRRFLSRSILAIAFGLALPVWAQQVTYGPGMVPDASNATYPDALNNLFPGVVTAALSTSNTAAQNNAAIQAAITAACSSSTPTKAVQFLPGTFSLSSSTISIPCGSISIGGWGGYYTTVFNVGTGNGDLFKCTQPSGGANGCLHAEFHDFSLIRSDSPTSGAGISLDYANDVLLNRMRVYGFFTNVDCNSCQNVTFGNGFNAGGVQTQAGSKIVHIRRTIASVATVGATASGNTITVASTTDIRNSMVVTGHANIPGGTTVSSYNSATNVVTLSAAVTGNVPDATTLTFTGRDTAANRFLGGVRLAGNPASNYDNGVVVNNSDGLEFAEVGINSTRGADLLVQPLYASDGVHGITTTPNTYFDVNDTHCIALKAYGAVEAVTGGTTAAGNTTLTLTGAPSVNVDGYSILANGVDTGTTVSSGGTTSSITMSAGANTLGVTSGAWVVFYPAYTGTSGSHIFQGSCNQPGDIGVLLADPAATQIRLSLKGHNSQKEMYAFRAGSGINASGSMLYNANMANGGYPTVTVEGSATGVDLSSGLFRKGTNNVAYHISKKGQAGSLTASGHFIGPSTTLDVSDAAVTSGATKMGACSTDNPALSTVNGVGCPLIGQLAATALPFVIPSSGSMADNGALTVTTALDRTYARAYFYLPANAISAGSSAGWYYTVCTTTTACSVKNNTYTSGIPTIPTPVAFATTGPGAYTQTTGAEIVAQSLTVPANSMGANGTLEAANIKWVFANTVGAKTAKVKFGSTNAWALALTSKASLLLAPINITNRSITTQQVTTNNIDAGAGSNTTVLTQAGENTASNVTFALSCQLATDTDYCAVESLRLNLWPSP